MKIDSFRIADSTDAETIAQLVNGAYRPKQQRQGWTHEADLVSGERTNAHQVAETIARAESVILLALSDTTIIASAHIEKEGERCHIGMVAVSPALQGQGVGKRVLAQAEQYARATYGAKTFTMLVLSARAELISFYLRRGYHKTGVVMEYPLSAGAGAPRRPDLKIERLEKGADTPHGQDQHP